MKRSKLMQSRGKKFWALYSEDLEQSTDHAAIIAKLEKQNAELLEALKVLVYRITPEYSYGLTNSKERFIELIQKAEGDEDF